MDSFAVDTYRDAPEPPGWLDGTDPDGTDWDGNTQPEPGEPTPAVVWHKAAEIWKPQEPLTWLVELLIGLGNLMLLFGDPGTGKTYLVFALAVCVAAGLQFLGVDVCAGLVILIDEESGFARITKRLSEIVRGLGIGPENELPITFATLQGFNFFAEPAWFYVLQQQITATNAKLVVIDALADVMLGGNENAVQDTQPVFHGLRVVTERTGATIIVVHHSNKQGGYRGSTAIPGAVDLALQVSRTGDDGPLKIETAKARDIAPAVFGCRGIWDGITESFRLEAVDMRPAGKVFSKPERYVLRFLRERGPAGADMETIKASADSCSPSSAGRAVFALVDKGAIKRIDGGKPRTPGVWAIVPGGIESEV